MKPDKFQESDFQFFVKGDVVPRNAYHRDVQREFSARGAGWGEEGWPSWVRGPPAGKKLIFDLAL